MDPSTVFFLPIAALAGWLAGGLVNWLADDLPHTFAVRLPHYPDGTRRVRIAWLGILAFLGGRRASPEGARLSWRHPLTELILIVLCVYIALENGPTLRALYLMGSLVFLALITVIDLEHRQIIVAVIVLASLYTVAGTALVHPWERIALQDHLIGGAFGFGVFLLMYGGGMLFSAIMASARGAPLDETAFGYGDVLLAMLSGLILGWQAFIFAATISVFVGGAGALLYLGARLATRGRYELFTALPYGQYIVFGTLVMMLWRTPVVNFLQRIG